MTTDQSSGTIPFEVVESDGTKQKKLSCTAVTFDGWGCQSSKGISVTVSSRRCQVHKVVQGTEHRPFNPKSDAHQAFLRKQLQKVDNLERKYPRLNLDDERGRFEAQLLEPVAASSQ